MVQASNVLQFIRRTSGGLVWKQWKMTNTRKANRKKNLDRIHQNEAVIKACKGPAPKNHPIPMPVLKRQPRPPKSETEEPQKRRGWGRGGVMSFTSKVEKKPVQEAEQIVSKQEPGEEKAKPEDGEKKAGDGEERKEVGGPQGLEPTRYGDWEKAGRCYDF